MNIKAELWISPADLSIVTLWSMENAALGHSRAASGVLGPPRIYVLVARRVRTLAAFLRGRKNRGGRRRNVVADTHARETRNMANYHKPELKTIQELRDIANKLRIHAIEATQASKSG